MLLYDATIDFARPAYSSPAARTVRMIYDSQGYISLLQGAAASQGVELMLSARPGWSQETATNSKHHHLSFISKNPVPYAELFGTKRFIFTYDKPGRELFLTTRYPEWTFLGYNENNIATMELIIP